MTSNEDLKPLQALYKEMPSARAAFDHWAGRKNNSTETKVETLQQAIRAAGVFPRAEIIDLFRELESAGCGQFIVGRKGHPSRFKWEVSPVSLAQVVTGESAEVEALPEDSEEDLDSLDGVEPVIEILEHRFHLRPDFEVNICLPEDLTQSEADRLADFMQTLSFERRDWRDQETE